MTEPAAGVTASGLSAALLAWIGVDVHTLFWACSGATFTLVMTDSAISRWRAVATVVVCSLAGAALGQYAAELVAPESRKALVALALVFGAGAQVLVPAVIGMLARRFGANKDGGSKV